MPLAFVPGDLRVDPEWPWIVGVDGLPELDRVDALDLPPRMSAITWRERSASTCLPCSGRRTRNGRRRPRARRNTSEAAICVRAMPVTLRKASTARAVRAS